MSFSVSDGLAPKPGGRGWLTPLALLAVAAAPVCAAVLAYFFWTPAAYVNYGDLIAPRALPDVRLEGIDGRPFRLHDLNKRWVLVNMSSGRCDEQCVRRHFYMRQVRLMQGRNTERVERLWLITDDVQPDPKLLEAYAGMHVARARRDVVAAFPSPTDPGDHIYLIDPLGHVMLRFPMDPDPKGMNRDLSRLLRASRIG